MKKFICRNLCALLLASLFITGSLSPVARLIPTSMRQMFVPTTAYAWTFGLDTLISILAGGGAAGLAVFILVALGQLPLVVNPPFVSIVGKIAIGGIAILGKKLADERLDYILIRMAEKWKSQGKTLSQIEHEIDELPAILICDSRKAEVKRVIRPYMK